MPENFPPEECPECGSLNIVYSKLRDEIICNDCGCIYARTVAVRLEREVPEKKVKRKKAKAKKKKAGRKAKKGKAKKGKKKKRRR